ncbi:MAG: ATP-dependent DNA helicase RecG [Rickettsiaceae bacterium]|nr:ATP-dependent DNA helicase RecG [Rickettsiaceae bacterium]
MVIEKLSQDASVALGLKAQAKLALARIGIKTISDLLLYKPTYYIQRAINPNLSKLTNQEEVVIKVKIIEISLPKKKSGITKVACSNETGSITLVFFKIHQFMKQVLQVGKYISCSGKVEFYDHLPQILHPEIIFDLSFITKFEPRYGLTYGLTNNQIRQYISKYITIAKSLPEWLPREIITQNGLPSFFEALSWTHFATDSEKIEKANFRLKLDEALSNQIGFKLLRRKSLAQKNRIFQPDVALQKRVMSRFGYSLTESQRDVILSIQKDQASYGQMMRMVQGDVGAGKTIVALLSSINVLREGGQVALLAPTEVLATQHFNFISKMLEGEGYEIALITSRPNSKNRDKLLESISSGRARYIIGTHAIFTADIKFNDLAFVVIDEQHKFGVQQRMEIINKGNVPDVLIMSATPIPRTLSMTQFGDLAMSRITQIPSNRKIIQTFVSTFAKMDDIIKAISTRLAKGEKVYWVCPLIESKENSSSENSDLINRSEFLRSIFGDKVSQLHGGINPEKKNEIIAQFRGGISPLLVSTTVVEVGVDVPDATLIIIENAEKFGLAQLHQLRGRVGRGEIQSSCILLRGERLSEIAKERLKIMKESSDGFFIAEKDLALRGEGEFFGEKQSGDQNFRFLDIAEDADIIEIASNIANKEDDMEKYNILMTLFTKIAAKQDIIL